MVSVLREHGCEQVAIEQELEIYGPDLQKCIEFFLVPSDPAHVADQIGATEESWAAHVMQGLGFNEIGKTEALEIYEFFVSAALRLLLLGNNKAKALHLGVNHFRRHTTNKVDSIPEKILASDPAREADRERARLDLGMQVRVVDLGQYAGGTTAVCFWLSLAAGLAHARWQVPGQALQQL